MSINSSIPSPAILSYDEALAAVGLHGAPTNSLGSASSAASESSLASREGVLEQAIRDAQHALSRNSEDARGFRARFTANIVYKTRGEERLLPHAIIPESTSLEEQLEILKRQASHLPTSYSHERNPLCEKRIEVFKEDIFDLENFINEKNAIITAATRALAELRSRAPMQPVAPASVPSPLVVTPAAAAPAATAATSAELPSDPSIYASLARSCVIL